VLSAAATGAGSTAPSSSVAGDDAAEQDSTGSISSSGIYETLDPDAALEQDLPLAGDGGQPIEAEAGTRPPAATGTVRGATQQSILAGLRARARARHMQPPSVTVAQPPLLQQQQLQQQQQQQDERTTTTTADSVRSDPGDTPTALRMGDVAPRDTLDADADVDISDADVHSLQRGTVVDAQR
jgi:hypothetical protein